MIDNHSNGMSGIGFTYNSKDKEDIYNESQMMLVSGNKLCLDVLDIDKFKDIEEIKFSINSIQNKIPHLINPTEQKTHSKGKAGRMMLYALSLLDKGEHIMSKQYTKLQLKHQQQMRANREAEKLRKARTHRLIVRGAIVESLILMQI